MTRRTREKRKIVVIALGWLLLASAGHSQEGGQADLTDHVRSNEITRNGYWFELHNVSGNWEKVMLIYGYAGDGNEQECAVVLEAFEALYPASPFRCNSVE